jgi:DNA repair protein RecO (recombination protein O)
MARIKDQAICIRLIDWSETSQVVALLTEHHGKLRGLAKGAKRMSPGAIARFSGGIELLTLGQVVAIAKPATELANITEWDLQQPWPHLRQSLRAQQLGLYAADLTNALLAEADPHPQAFVALADLLAALVDAANHPAALLRFQWQLLREAGFQPRLHEDVRTGQTLKRLGTYLFDARGGGLTADTAPGGDDTTGPWRVRAQTVTLLQRMAADEDITGEPADVVGRANRLLCVYVRAILDRQLPTMKAVLG